MSLQNRIERISKPAILLIAFSFIFSFAAWAQEKPVLQEEQIEYAKNWIYDYQDGPELRLNYKYYSKEDAVDAENKYQKIKAELLENKENEWAGKYIPLPQSELGGQYLFLAPRSGFIDYYVYPCLPELRSFHLGDVVDEPSVIWTKPVYSLNSRRRVIEPVRYVKVKWGARRLLVRQEDLVEFLDRVTGFYVKPKTDDENDFSDWFNVWANEKDFEKPLTGLPVLPAEYVHLLRRPIEAKIINAGKRIIKKIEEKNDEHEYSAARTESQTTVTISAGSQNGIKIGMAFRALKTDETIKIIQVNSRTSIGVLIRELDENGRETYYDSESEGEKNFPKITAGWSLTTAPLPQSFECFMC